MKNSLIVFEGIDGAGKTTIAKKLHELFIRLGIPCVFYEDYEKKDHGFNLIKPFIGDETPIDSSLFFYIASAIYKSQEIKFLLRDNWVICDRYVYSTLAYHRARGANLNLIPLLKKLPIILPDFYFLLEVDEPLRLKRLAMKQNTEPLDFLPKSHGSFFDRIERYLIEHKPIILNNSQTETDSIINEIIGIIKLS